MSNYVKTVNFAVKDSLLHGDPNKVVKGVEIDTEYNNLATASATKTDNAAALITGGSINGVTIGNSVPGAGTFTTLTATTGLSGTTITGGSINNTPIGGTTPAAGTFTTLVTTAGGGASVTNINVGVAGDGLQHNLRIYGTSTLNKAPVLSLFRSGSNEYFIAGGSSVGAELGFGVTTGLADYNDTTLAAQAQVSVTTSGFKVRSGGIDFNAQALSTIGNATSMIYEAGVQHIFRLNGAGTEMGRFTTSGLTTAMLQAPASTNLTIEVPGPAAGGFLNCGGSHVMSWNTTGIFPSVSGTLTCGSSGALWNAVYANNLGMAGVASPSIVFTPSSGATANAQLYQSGNTLYIAQAGAANRLQMDITNGATTLYGQLGVSTGGGAPTATHVFSIATASDARMDIHSTGNAALRIVSNSASFASIDAMDTGFTVPKILWLNPNGNTVRVAANATGGLQVGDVAYASLGTCKLVVGSATGKGGGSTDENLFSFASNDASGELRLYGIMGASATGANRYMGMQVHEYGVVTRELVLQRDGANVRFCGTPGAATGMVVNASQIFSAGTFTFGCSGATQWSVDIAAGQLAPLSDGAYDIGKPAQRVRNLYITGTVSGSIAPVFESAELTVALATVVTAAHGLGRVPKMWHAFLRCKTAQANYAVGDEVVAASFMDSGGNACNFSTYADATNVGVVIGSTQVTLANRTGGTIGQNVGLTVANWRLVIRVWG